MPPKGISTRSAVDIQEETKASIELLVDFQSERSMHCVIPRLPSKGRQGQHARWGEGVGEALLEALVTCINDIRAAQRERGSTTSDITPAGALRLLDALAGGSDAFEQPEAFIQLAAVWGVAMQQRRHTRHSGFVAAPPAPPAPPAAPPAPASTPGAPPNVTPPAGSSILPTRSRSGANALDEEHARTQTAEAIVAELQALDPLLVEEVGRTLGDALVATLGLERRPSAAAAPPMEPAPELPRAAEEAPEETPLQVAKQAISKLDETQLDELIDDVSEIVFGSTKRDRACIRRLAIARRRVAAYKDQDGIQQCDFILSILECYGADEEERLPLCSVLSWFLFYAHRSADDAHWGHSITTLHFDQDGGMYLDAWSDLMDHAGHVAVNVMRGHMFSNMVKAERTTRGRLSLRDMTLAERSERLFFGTAVPSTQALNQRVKPEDKVDRGGMSKPIERSLETFRQHVQTRASKLMGRELAPLSMNDLLAVDRAATSRAFNHEALHREMHGGQVAVAILPKMPKEGWKECDRGKWWARPPQTVEP